MESKSQNVPSLRYLCIRYVLQQNRKFPFKRISEVLPSTLFQMVKIKFELDKQLLGGSACYGNPPKGTIYLVPIGEFEPGRSPSLPILAQILQVYVGLPVSLQPTLPIKIPGPCIGVPPNDEPSIDIGPKRVLARPLHYGSYHWQINASDMLTVLNSIPRPLDCILMLGITCVDLYLKVLSFVFRNHSSKQNLAIASCARLYPNFMDDGQPLNQEGKDYLFLMTLKNLLTSACTGLGLSYCKANYCKLQGTPSLGVLQQTPLVMCKNHECLLQNMMRFDPEIRNMELSKLGDKFGKIFEVDAEVYKNRVHEAKRLAEGIEEKDSGRQKRSKKEKDTRNARGDLYEM